MVRSHLNPRRGVAVSNQRDRTPQVTGVKTCSETGVGIVKNKNYAIVYFIHITWRIRVSVEQNWRLQ